MKLFLRPNIASTTNQKSTFLYTKLIPSVRPTQSWFENFPDLFFNFPISAQFFYWLTTLFSSALKKHHHPLFFFFCLFYFTSPMCVPVWRVMLWVTVLRVIHFHGACQVLLPLWLWSHSLLQHWISRAGLAPLNLDSISIFAFKFHYDTHLFVIDTNWEHPQVTFRSPNTGRSLPGLKLLRETSRT